MSDASDFAPISAAVQTLAQHWADSGLAIILLPPADDLAAAERALGLQFPASYRHFATQVRTTTIPVRDIVADNAPQPELPAFVALPRFLVAFAGDAYGNSYCFDTRATHADGEFAIVFWDHERSTDEQLARLVTTDRDFPEWLLRRAASSAPGTPFTQRRSLGFWACGCVVVLGLVVLLAAAGFYRLVGMQHHPH